MTADDVRPSALNANDLIIEIQERFIARGAPSLRRVAALSGVSHQTISEVLKGNRGQHPRIYTLVAIANALGADYAPEAKPVTIKSHGERIKELEIECKALRAEVHALNARLEQLEKRLTDQ